MTGEVKIPHHDDAFARKKTH